MAGHTQMGGYCDCGTSGCICDPGETPIGQSNNAVSDEATAPVDSSEPTTDLGSEALMLMVVLLVWLRARA